MACCSPPLFSRSLTLGLPSLASICQTRSLGPGPSFLTTHICFLVSPGPGGPRLWPGGSPGSLRVCRRVHFCLFELAFAFLPVAVSGPRSSAPRHAPGFHVGPGGVCPPFWMDFVFSVCWLGPPGCPGAKWHFAARRFSEMWSRPSRCAFLLPALVIYFSPPEGRRSAC